MTALYLSSEFVHPAEVLGGCQASRRALDDMLESYAREREAIRQVVSFHRDNSALRYFIEGADVNGSALARVSVAHLLNEDAAAKALDATYWARAIRLTDVLELMPAVERNKWHECIARHNTPAFARETVYSTLEDLVLRREDFFCQRVDGVFRSLSGQHVTNVPEGFAKRMILEHVHAGSASSLSSGRKSYIHDLRVIASTFLGRAAPPEEATSRALRDIIASERFGAWHDFDGQAFKVRLYKKGTAHIEVHPDIAYRMNAVLAKLHPAAIPSRFRMARRVPLDIVLRDDILPDHTLASLARLGPAWKHDDAWVVGFSANDRGHVDIGRQHVTNLLQQIGGALSPGGIWRFDFDPTAVLTEMLRTARVPDESYQFFETPSALVEELVALAEIEAHHTVLEPSAGRGAIATALQAQTTICVEVSALRCAILRAKGFDPIEADFLSLPPSSERVDRVVMNPPFSKGRAREHVRRAADHWLRPGGRLVAILPAGLRGQILAPGWTHQYSDVMRDRFPGTGVAVVLLTLSH